MNGYDFFRGFIIVCCVGGGIQVMIFSNLVIPLVIGLGVFALAKGKITNYVYDEATK